MTLHATDSEAARLDALHRLGVLDTPPEQAYDDLCRLAAAVCGTPIAVVSLVDARRQWFKARVGVDAAETGREVAFCDHAIRCTDLMEVPDAAADPRFRHNPLVTGEPHIRFYAGMPMTVAGGHAVGTLCVIDRRPRTLTPEQADALRALGRQATAQLELRRQVAALHESEGRFRAVVDQAADAWFLHAADGTIVDVNRQACDGLGYAREELLGRSFRLYDPHLSAADHDRLQASDRPVTFETRHRRKDGAEFPVEVRVGRLVLDGRPHRAAVARDLSDRRRAEAALRESEERFRAFMDHGPAVAFMEDEHGRNLYVNEPLRRHFGVAAADWHGKTEHERFPPDVADALRACNRAVLADGRPTKVREMVPDPDGTPRWWATYRFRLAGPAGRPLMAGMAVDVTDEERTAAALQASETKFRVTLDRLAEGVYLVDPAGPRVVEANAALLDMLGYTAAEVVDSDPLALVAGESAAAQQATLRQAHARLAEHGRCDLGRRLFRRKDGGTVPVEVKVSVVPTPAGELHAVIVRDLREQLEHEDRLFRYQEELEAANARLKELAVTDGLTGAKNRAAFNERLADEYDRSVRHDRPLSVVLLDVDHFKPFNDTFGHPAGDAVLRQVVRLLHATVRGSDVVARYGGEEFVVLLPDTDFGGAMVLAERCRRAVAGATWEHRPVTVSVGVATRTIDTPDAAALVREADEALYRSKRAGRNRVNHGSAPIGMAATVRN